MHVQLLEQPAFATSVFIGHYSLRIDGSGRCERMGIEGDSSDRGNRGSFECAIFLRAKIYSTKIIAVFTMTMRFYILGNTPRASYLLLAAGQNPRAIHRRRRWNHCRLFEPRSYEDARRSSRQFTHSGNEHFHYSRSRISETQVNDRYATCIANLQRLQVIQSNNNYESSSHSFNFIFTSKQNTNRSNTILFFS